MKLVIEDREIYELAEIEIYSATKFTEEPLSDGRVFRFGVAYGAPIADAISQASAECRQDPELIIRITIETVKAPRT